MKTSKKETNSDLLKKSSTTHESRLSARSSIVNNNDINRLSPRPSRQATSLSPTRQLRDHPFGVPDEECLLNSSRSNSSNSLCPSAKSSSSMESYLSFPRISNRNSPNSRQSTTLPGNSKSNNLPGPSTSSLPSLLPPLPECVLAYDNLITNALAQYIRYSNTLGQEVFRQAQIVKTLFDLQREFILCSTGTSFSDSSGAAENPSRHLVSPIGSGPAQASKMREVKTFAMRHVYSSNAPHIHFVADTIGALGWIVSGDRPSHFIRESYDGGKHHVKNIPGMDSKSAPINLSALTDTQLKIHSSWVQTWQNVIIDLDTYVRDFHPRGLKWKKGN